MIDKNTRILVVGGPTASGKSALALALARRFGGVVINADSMQVYADLALLTARPGAVECKAAPHRLYGVLHVPQVCSAGEWRRRALVEIDAALSAGHVPIVVGGTGLYLRSLLEGIADIPPIAPEIRAAARAEADRIGTPALHAELALRDPVMAARLRPSDRQRLVRAWEVLAATGRSIAEWQGEGSAPFPGQAFSLLVDPDAGALGRLIDARLDAMVAAGAIEEVRELLALHPAADHPLMRAVGVPQFAAHLQERLAAPDAVAAAKVATRQYAKRQRTWFRGQFQSNLTITEMVTAQYLVNNQAKIFALIDQFQLTQRG
jgi:tRNA dimethylallyltransferase